MLNEFIDFVDSVLPSVSPDVKNRAKAAIEQFEIEGKQIHFLQSGILDQLSQGDIISKIPFSYFDENGQQALFTANGMIISTSCHIDNKDTLVIVPVLPIESFEGQIDQLKKNKIYDYMYIEEGDLSEQYINFEFMNTYDSDLIIHGIKESKISKLYSLNLLGYYFFIVKLTIYLMRKEDSETQKERGDIRIS